MCRPSRRRLCVVPLSLVLSVAGQDTVVFFQQQIGLHGPDAAATTAVHVSSIGGVGTTSFMHELHGLASPVLTNSAGDKDFIKHVPYPKAAASKFFKEAKVRKIIYLVGDPVHAVTSIARRGWLQSQAEKTRSERMPRERPKTLEQYARAPDDFMQLEQHFDSFFQQCDYPVAFLRIEEKTEHLRELAAFLGRWVEDLRWHMQPWHLVQKAEEEKEKKEEDAAGELTPEGLANATIATKAAAAKNSRGGQLPSGDVAQEIKDLLTAKFQNLTAKYRMLSGFQVFRPRSCEGGRRRPLAPAAPAPRSRP